MKIRPIRPEDSAEWLRLRCALWPDGAEDHGYEIAEFFAGRAEEPAAVFVVESDGRVIALMELSVRMNLLEFVGQRVGYVEGLYVGPELRGRNVARLLLQTARAWAREERCVTVASDRAERIVIDGKYRM